MLHTPASPRFLATVHWLHDALQVIGAGGSGGQDGLTGFLWSPDVTSFFSEYMKRMSGTVLENLEGHPEFPGLAFEHGEQYSDCT